MGSLSPELAAAAEAEKAAQDAPTYYPPTRLGMRGSHPGAFEAAHEVRDGDFWNNATALVDTHESYDLVVVGGGISGLSAAYFYRQKHPQAKILIIENHDDFGGHAKRNEFNVGGRVLLANGGTQDMDSPYPYSTQARGLMKALGIDPVKLHKECADPAIYKGSRPPCSSTRRPSAPTKSCASIPATATAANRHPMPGSNSRMTRRSAQR
ncbi:MAG: FAD-dependent oxidoreductase [Rhizomicrobium sp.]